MGVWGGGGRALTGGGELVFHNEKEDSGVWCVADVNPGFQHITRGRWEAGTWMWGEWAGFEEHLVGAAEGTEELTGDWES